MVKTRSNEELAEIAKSYDYMPEFRKKEHAAYIAICKRGLLHLCNHMERKRRYHLTDDDLAEIASRYDVLAEFIEKEKSAYSLICSRGLYEKLCGRMQRERATRSSDEELTAIANKYDDLVEFKKKEYHAYNIICNRGLYDKLCAHMKRGKKARYSDEELSERASKYNSMMDFYTKEKGAFLAICRRGLIGKLCGHLERKGSLYRRKIYVFTFSDGYAYVGLAKDPKSRYRDHMAGKDNSPILQHIQETGASHEFTLLTDWLDKDVAAKMEDDYINQYVAEGWKMLNKARGGSLGSLTRYYTDKRIRQEISEYEYFEDFKKGSPGFYRYVRNHRLIDEYCSHMKSRQAEIDKKRMAIIASCKTSGELWKKNRTIYKWLHKHHRLYEFYPKIDNTLTDEERMAIITSCRTSGELMKKSPREYKWLQRHHRLREFFPLEHKPMTDEERMAIITRCKSRKDLYNNHNKVYQWLWSHHRLDEFFPK